MSVRKNVLKISPNEIGCYEQNEQTAVAYPTRLVPEVISIQDGGIIYTWRKIYARWWNNLCRMMTSLKLT